LFAGGLLVLLDNLVGNPVQDRVILSVYGCTKQSDGCYEQRRRCNFFNHAANLLQ
jgi:hypothetical protein